MWNPRPKSILLWGPFMWVIVSTFWLRRLRRLQAHKAFVAREKLLLDSEPHSLPIESLPNTNHININGNNMNVIEPQIPEETVQPLLISIVSVLRTIVIWFWVANMASNEISSLYCKGHTVLSYILSNLADIATNREKYGIARVLLQISLSWNSLWSLGPIHPPSSSTVASLGNASQLAVESLKVIDPVASNLQQLALLAARTNQHRRFKAYSTMLAERNFSIKKQIAREGWKKVKEKAKTWSSPLSRLANSLLDRN